MLHPPAESPLLYDSPHSGREYPADFHSRASHLELRRGEDAYVDELLAPSVAHGATLVVNDCPRCYIDVNREMTDVDSDQLAGPWPADYPPLAPTEKSRRGLGLIRRFVTPGVEAQAAPLTADAILHRIEHVYEPYYRTLGGVVRSLRARHGRVWHVNWHSMKSVGNAMTPDGPGAKRADFVVSDGRGTTASTAVTDCVVDLLRDLGFRVTVNDPYLGGTIVKRTGEPARGVHSIQIEINRALYLDEAAVEKTPAFATLATHLETFTRRLLDAALSMQDEEGRRT